MQAKCGSWWGRGPRAAATSGMARAAGIEGVCARAPRERECTRANKKARALDRAAHAASSLFDFIFFNLPPLSSTFRLSACFAPPSPSPPWQALPSPILSYKPRSRRRTWRSFGRLRPQRACEPSWCDPAAATGCRNRDSGRW